MRRKIVFNTYLILSELIVLVIAVTAFLIAANPACQGLMGLVACAWAAFGSAFGPVMLTALFWKRLTYWGAVAGIMAGFTVDILWYCFMGWTGIYEIIPGFLAGLAATAIVSLIDKKPAPYVLDLFVRSRGKID